MRASNYRQSVTADRGSRAQLRSNTFRNPRRARYATERAI